MPLLIWREGTLQYQDLSGGVGRKVYYRPQRYRSGVLFGEVDPVIRVGDLNARLLDLSISGLACELGTQASSHICCGSVVPLQLWLREEKAFSAQVEVVRADGASRRIAVRFLDSVPDPGSLRALAQAQRARAAIRDGVDVFDCVPAAYRTAIHQVATVLTHWKRLLDQRELELSASGNSRSELVELESLAEKRMRVDWFKAHAVANEAAEELFKSQEVLRSSKALTELLVTPLLRPAPIWRRAYEKPRGYPGDFELMNYMYDEDRAGESVYGRIMHQLGREERLASTVRNRRDLLARHIRKRVAHAAALGREQVRICNIGAGPARELEEILSGGDLPIPLHLWLVDQDEDALAFAYERLRKASLAVGHRVQISCRFASFKQILSNAELLQEVAGQDLIYSAGLFDYLSQPTAKALLRQLAGLLRRDGCLFVGNAATTRGIKWVPEFVLDWRLRDRSPEEMLDLARALPEGTQVEIRADDSQSWLFLMALPDGSS